MSVTPPALLRSRRRAPARGGPSRRGRVPRPPTLCANRCAPRVPPHPVPPPAAVRRRPHAPRRGPACRHAAINRLWRRVTRRHRRLLLPLLLRPQHAKAQAQGHDPTNRWASPSPLARPAAAPSLVACPWSTETSQAGLRSSGSSSCNQRACALGGRRAVALVPVAPKIELSHLSAKRCLLWGCGGCRAPGLRRRSSACCCPVSPPLCTQATPVPPAAGPGQAGAPAAAAAAAATTVLPLPPRRWAVAGTRAPGGQVKGAKSRLTTKG
jgi:hypothetical protein